MNYDERIEKIKEQIDLLKDSVLPEKYTHETIIELIEKEIAYEYNRKQNIEFRSSIFIAALVTLSGYVLNNYKPYFNKFFADGHFTMNIYILLEILSLLILFFLVRSFYYFFKTFENANSKRIDVASFTKVHFNASYFKFIEQFYVKKKNNYIVISENVDKKSKVYDSAIKNIKIFLALLLVKYILEIILFNIIGG